MFRGILALFFRSLRSESRSFWLHFSRVLLLAAFYFGIEVAQEQSLTIAAPGLSLFKYAIYANLTFLTLLGISYFSSVISEEREEGTLGLILMTGVSPLGFLLGKSASRLVQVLVLLVLQLPFTLLSITLGGLAPGQIVGAYLALAAYAILVASIGLFCSVVCRKSRDAASLALMGTIAYALIPLTATTAITNIERQIYKQQPFWIWVGSDAIPTLDWIRSTNILSEFSQTTSSTYQFHISPLVISHVAAGIVLFLISWWLFGVIAYEETQEERVITTSTPWLGRLGTGRAWKWAFAWKDFHFIAGGWIGCIGRVLVYVGLFLIGLVQSRMEFEDQFENLMRIYRIFIVPIFVIDCALCLSRTFQDEIRHQTLSSLLMLPTSTRELISGKLWGCLLGLTPGMIAVTAAFLMPATGDSIAETVRSHAFWSVIAHVLFGFALCVLLSTYMRTAVIVTSFAITAAISIAPMILAQWMELSDTRLRLLYTAEFSGLVVLTVTIAWALVTRVRYLGSR